MPPTLPTPPNAVGFCSVTATPRNPGAPRGPWARKQPEERALRPCSCPLVAKTSVAGGLSRPPTRWRWPASSNQERWAVQRRRFSRELVSNLLWGVGLALRSASLCVLALRLAVKAAACRNGIPAADWRGSTVEAAADLGQRPEQKTAPYQPIPAHTSS